MLPRSMPMSMAGLRRLITETRSSKFPDFSNISKTLVARTFVQRAIASRVLQSTQNTQATSVTLPAQLTTTFDNAILRTYATTTRKRTTTKKTTTKKKTAARKKTAKKPAKKAKKKAVKKAAKPTRPKTMKLPSPRGISGYVVYIQEQMKGASGDIASRFRNVSASWKALSETEKDNYRNQANAVNASRKQEYQNAISQMTPAQIKEENSKRRVLAKKFSKSGKGIRLIKDPNAPKRPQTAYLRFATESYTPGTPISESAKQAGQRWKSMSESQKRPYVEAYTSDKARYEREMATYTSS